MYAVFLAILLSSLYSDAERMGYISAASNSTTNIIEKTTPDAINTTEENAPFAISTNEETTYATTSQNEEIVLSAINGKFDTPTETYIIEGIVSFEKHDIHKTIEKGSDEAYHLLMGKKVLIGSFEEKSVFMQITMRIKYVKHGIEEKEEQIPTISTLDSRLPAVVFLHINEESPKDPLMLSNERISEDDVLVDLSTAIDYSTKYAVDYSLEQCIARVVYREAGNQPFLGQLLVAEDVVNRLRSGLYGTNVSAILAQGYLVQTDSAGNFHVYNGSGVEIIDVPNEAITATKLALSGTNTSNLILQAATEIRNSQYNLDLGEQYYIYGAMYHYNPDGIDASAMSSRTINRVPVSFKYAEHVFYGHWLNKAAALNI